MSCIIFVGKLFSCLLLRGTKKNNTETTLTSNSLITQNTLKPNNFREPCLKSSTSEVFPLEELFSVLHLHQTHQLAAKSLCSWTWLQFPRRHKASPAGKTWLQEELPEEMLSAAHPCSEMFRSFSSGVFSLLVPCPSPFFPPTGMVLISYQKQKSSQGLPQAD